MKTFITLTVLLLILNGCCDISYQGYGRYTLTPDCERVIIDDVEYTLTKQDNGEFVIDGHTLYRGIYRKTRPWLYVHTIDTENNKVDVTFDSGEKPDYPLYTGNTASIFDVYAKPYEIKESTCALFSSNYWLVAHKFTADGVYLDLQQNNNGWILKQEDIFVPADGSFVEITQINTRVKITNYDAQAKTGIIEFIQI